MEGEDDKEETWGRLLDPILDQVLSLLTARQVLDSGLVCRHWHARSRDNLLWRGLFHRDYKVKCWHIH